ncbi:unnamed protein product [Heterobilharzia americana]|nr:unnamed protein product [Heterobilharzia americana]
MSLHSSGISKMFAKLLGCSIRSNFASLRNHLAPLSILRIPSVSRKTLENRLAAHPSFNQIRWIKRGLSRAEVEDKVLAVCSAYDKIQPDKLTLDSSFMKDLGLDSLDHIEVIMEIENEFWFEISDVEAEKMHTPRDIVEHICNSMMKVEPVT